MKTYNEMAEAALLRIKKQREKIRRRNKIITGTMVPLISLVMLSGIGFTAWQIKDRESHYNISQESDLLLAETERKTNTLYEVGNSYSGEETAISTEKKYVKHEINYNEYPFADVESSIKQIITGTKDTATEIQDMATPKNGEFFCHIPLRKACEESAPNTLFLVKFGIFENDSYIEDNDNRIFKAYSYLISMGVEFREVTYVSYEYDIEQYKYSNEIEFSSKEICAVMTKEQILNFSPTADFGYALGFLINGYSDDIIDIDTEEIKTFDELAGYVIY